MNKEKIYHKWLTDNLTIKHNKGFININFTEPDCLLIEECCNEMI